MQAPATIANAARERLHKNSQEIEHSLAAIAGGRPGDAETDVARRAAVLQARTGMSTGEAARAAPRAGAEAVWGQTIDFVDASFFERGLIAARAVCRIITRGGRGIGTGFLISPRLLITNNHVIGSESAAGQLLAEFDYERDLTGVPRPTTQFELAADTLFVTNHQDDLDYTVVAVAGRVLGEKELSQFGFLGLSGARNKHALGDFVNIIQHPDARMKEAVVRENQLVGRPKSGTVLHYVADTEPGSSGSPVLNLMFSVVALHHWGGPHRELFDEKDVRVPRTVNEGIRASAISLDLQTRLSALPEAKRALIEQALKVGMDQPNLPGPDREISGRPRPDGNGSPSDRGVLSSDGTVTWYIPLAVSVKLGALPADTAAQSLKTAGPALLPAPQATANRSEAKLELDENYKDRSGYDSSFLPGVVVPLPKLSRETARLAATNRERAPGDDPHELKYEHFSVVMNGKRRLAFFTATNIDGKLAKDVDRVSGTVTDAAGVSDDEDEALGAEAAEQWLKDRRIKAEEQTPPDLFAGQTTFDSDGRPITDRRTNEHRNRMFQQGHLTRRQDPLWGNEDAALRANTDTFHVTNRAPQVGYFNMGTRKRGSEARGHPGGTLHWRALEDFVLLNARADRDRVTVFTGPIFDDDNDFPWSRGRDDLKGFKAPREFWKLVLRVEGGALHATALVADQSPLIDFLPEMLEVSGEEARRIAFDKVAKYQVSVAELANRTKLDFGSAVRGADTFAGGGERAKSKRVSEFNDLIVGLPTKPQRAAAARATDASRRSSAPRGKKKRGAGVRRKR